MKGKSFWVLVVVAMTLILNESVLGLEGEKIIPADVAAAAKSTGDSRGGMPAGSQASCPDATIEIEIMTDGYPEDTTWQLDQRDGGQVASGGPLSDVATLHTWEVCVDSTGCYDFVIHDGYGDGICCGEGSGYYSVYYEGSLVGSGGAFGYSETVESVGDGCLPASCGDGTCDPDESCVSCPEDCQPCAYCEACYSNQTDSWITKVSFHTLENTTGQNGSCSYGDYTALSATVSLESTYTLRVSFFSSGEWTEHVRAWIDWDQDYVFEPQESYYFGSGIDATLSRQVTIPAGAALGCTRMRVVDNFDVDANEACPNLFYGEIEDYTVCVVPEPSSNLLIACALLTLAAWRKHRQV